MSEETRPRTGLIVLGSGIAYLLAYFFNEYALAFTRFSDGVNWVYLPSGLRLTLVLIFGWPAALGIAWSSVALAAWPMAVSALPQALVTGLISGFAPWLALLASERWLLPRQDLDGLQARSLLTLALVFALVSAGLHQAWYGWIKPSPEWLYGFAVMTLGDLVGSVIVLYLCRWALWLLASRTR